MLLKDRLGKLWNHSNIVDNYEIELFSVSGVSFSLLFNLWQLSKDTSVNYILLVAKNPDSKTEF